MARTRLLRASTLQQWGITWKFDEDYSVGQFANLDFWVVGPVTIIGIDPASTLEDSRVKNGAMLNPSPGEKSQGYDNDMREQPVFGRSEHRAERFAQSAAHARAAFIPHLHRSAWTRPVPLRSFGGRRF